MRRFSYGLRLTGLVLISASFCASAGDKVHLFNALSEYLPAPGAGTISEQVVVMDPAALRDATTIEVNIPGYQHVVDREAFESRPGGAYRWYGRIDALNDVLITSDGRWACVMVGGPDGLWMVRPFGVGSHLLTVVDTNFIGPPDEVIEPPGPELMPKPLKYVLGHLTTGALPDVASPKGDEISYIDLLVLYTVGARDGAGGDAQIRNFAQCQVDYGNQVFANSLVSNVRYRLRHASLSGIQDHLTAQITLDTLRTRPGLAQMRNTYGADSVILINEQFSNFVAGIAHVQRVTGPTFAPFAVGVIARHWSLTSPVFPHEAGHILGMEHNPEDSPVTPAQASFPWSFGHRTPIAVPAPANPGFRTVMATGNGGFCGTPCTQIPYFSNPDIVFGPPYNGIAAGVPDQRDNARTARLIGPGNSLFYPETDVIFAGYFEPTP